MKAGVYRTALIESMQSINGEQSLFQKQLEDSMNSAGSAAKENLTYMNSIEAQQRKLIANAQEFAATSGEAYLEQGYRDVLNILKSLTQTANSLVQNFGLLPPLFGAATAGILLFSRTARTLLTTTTALNASTGAFRGQLIPLKRQFRLTSREVRGATAGMAGFSATTKGATVAIRSFKNAFKGALISTGIGVGIVVLTTVMGKLMEQSAQARAEEREFRQELEKRATVYDQNEGKISSLTDRYEELRNKSKLTKDEQKELTNVQNQLADILPDTVDNIDEQGNAHLRNVEAIRKEIDELNRLSQLRSAEFVDTGYDEEVKKIKSEIDGFKDELHEIMYPDTGSGLGGMGRLVNDLSAREQIRVDYLEGKINSLESSWSELDSEYAQHYAKIEGINNKLTQDQQEYVRTIQKTVDDTKQAKDEIQGFVEKINSLSAPAKNIKSETIKQLTDEQIKAINNYTTALKRQEEGVMNSSETMDLYESNLSRLSGDGLNLVKIATNAYTSSLEDNTDANEENTDAQNENEKEIWEKISATEMLTNRTSEQTEQIKQAVKVVSILSKMENLNAKQKEALSGATGFLAEMYPHLSGNIADNIDMIISEMEMMDSLNSASGQNANLMMTNQDNITKSTIDASNQRIRALLNEYKVLKQIMDSHIETNLATDGVVASNGFIQNVARKMGDVEGKLSEAYNTRREAIYGVDGIDRPDIDTDVGSSSSGSSSSSGDTPKTAEEVQADKQRKAWEEAQETLIPYIDSLKDVKHDIEKLRIERGMMEEGSDEYIQSLNDENVQLEKQRKENEKYRKEINKLIKTENLSDEKKRELSDRVSKLSLDYHRLEQTIYDNNQALDEFANKVEETERDVFKERSNAADKAINLLKEQHRTRLKFIEAEKQAEIDALDEQLTEYEKYVNDRIKILNREQSEDDFETEREKLQDRRDSLKNQIQILSLDNSQSAKAEVVKLRSELNDTIIDLDALKDKRQRDLRKQNYQDQLEQYKQEVKDEKEKVNKELEVERYRVQELLNNEKHWADMREDIIAGNVDNITDKLKDSVDELSKYNEDTIKEMGMSYTKLLSQIEKIKNAATQVKNSSYGEFNKDGIIHNGQRYRYGEFNNPSADKSDMTIVKDGKAYSYEDYVDALLDGKIQGFREGGNTGDWSGDGGKLGILHKREEILNQDNTEHLKNALSLTDNILTHTIPNFLKNFSFPQKQPSTATPSGSPSIHIENVYGTDRESANNLASMVRDNFKRRGF